MNINAAKLQRTILGLLSLLLFSSAPAYGVEIDDVLWGFDGTATGRSFLPVHVLVRNETGDPFTGFLTLEKEVQLGNRIGAGLIEAMVLAPGQKSWVHFYVFLDNGDMGQVWNWRLRWSGTQRGTIELESFPKQGPKARVLLLERDGLSGGSFGVPVLSEELFPPMVTATDSLDTVFLDHVPRWQESQREAFRDWLYRGGHVHVLQGAGGVFPRFPAPLEVLNAPADDATPSESGISRIGRGVITHQQRNRFELDRSFLKQTLPDRGQVDPKPAMSVGVEESDNSFFSRFNQMTTPRHNWLAIFLLGIVYWLMLFPGGWILGRSRTDYRVVLAALVTTIGLFSVCFSYIGARGYDETATVNSVAVAHHLGGNRWDVMQWSGVFVTDGGRYTITHAEHSSDRGNPSRDQTTINRRNSGLLYATPGNNHAVAGSIDNGPGGRMEVDIPPFTMRPFLHRMKASGPSWDIEIARIRFADDRSLEKLSLQLQPTSPISTLRKSWVIGNLTVFQLKPSSDGRELVLGNKLGHVSTLKKQPNQFAMANSRFWDTQHRPTEQLFEEMHQPLLSEMLRQLDPTLKEALRSDRLRLLLLADQPESFHVDNPQLRHQVGQVLFVQDLIIPLGTP
ncbi:MAG: hypothetical protein CMJ65_13375 [Planctomycetaceae bacterium]|nr:hypothetical protein [Planctomycetaceae bacterium]